MKSIRRLLAVGLILLAVSIVLWWVRSRVTPSAESARGMGTIPRDARSLVLVTMDTTRADRLQPYGATDIATPTLLSLANEGLVFESAYAVAPITLPAHSSIHTGLFPYSHGVRNNGTHSAQASLTTLAERLQEAGFRTGAFVSAAVLDSRYGLDQGFETYDDDLSAGRERHPRMVPDRPAEATVTAARAWLDGLGEDERFFLWVHLYDPHAAYSPPPPYRDRYRERLYDGEIAYMDAWIGQLLAHPRLAPEQRVIVAAAADHGESLGEHGEQTHGIFVYDATIRVPLIVKIPGGPAAARVRAPVSQVDLAPTFLDLLGQSPLEKVDGLSLTGLLERGEGGPRDLYAEAYLPYYTYGWAKLRSLRRGAWKLVDAPRPELFDLRLDPRELSDVGSTNSGALHDLRRDLSERIGDDGADARLELDAEAANQLRALGYLSVGTVARSDADRLDPKDGIELHVGLERARALQRDRLYDAAIRQIRQVLAKDPNNLAALTDLAQNLESAGQVDEAKKACEKALALDPSSTRLHTVLAGLEARQGQRERAIELLDAALRLDPGLVEAELQKVWILKQLRQGAQAEALAEDVKRRHPDRPQVLLTWAQAVAMPKGRREEAEQALRQAVAIDPFLVGGWRSLGQVLSATGRGDEAVAAWREALRRQPDDGDTHAVLGLALAQRRDEQAPHHLREALRLTEESRPDLLVALGGWLAEHGRLEEANAEYEKVLTLDPRHPGALNNRAIALYRSGRIAEAHELLTNLVKEHPRFADAWNNLAAVAVDRGQWGEAEKAASRSLGLIPDAVAALNNLGLAQQGLGQLDRAAQTFERATTVDPGYWEARLNLGLVEIARGNAGRAAAALEEVMVVAPGLPQAHYELGLLYAGPLADPARARTHLNAFLRAAPRHPAASVARERLQQLPAVP